MHMASNVGERVNEQDDAIDRAATAALVQAVQRGDRAAFRALYDEHKQRVYRTALRLLGSRTQAEDVTQDVFVIVYRQIDTFDYQSAFITWLYRITLNACYAVMRKAQRRAKYRAGSIDTTAFEQQHIAQNEAKSDAQVHRQEVERAIERALQALPPDLRATFVLREIEGLSYDELARVLKVAPGTVASRLARARQQLADGLSRLDFDESYLH